MIIDTPDLKNLIEELRKDEKLLEQQKNLAKTSGTQKRTTTIKIKLYINRIYPIFHVVDPVDLHNKRLLLIAATRRRIKKLNEYIQAAFV
jgi:hypothetical protein